MSILFAVLLVIATHFTLPSSRCQMQCKNTIGCSNFGYYPAAWQHSALALNSLSSSSDPKEMIVQPPGLRHFGTGNATYYVSVIGGHNAGPSPGNSGRVATNGSTVHAGCPSWFQTPPLSIGFVKIVPVQLGDT